MKQIPNLFTLLNLFFGCCAIVFVLQNGISIFYNGENPQLVDMPEKIAIASVFIGLAGVVDFLDGWSCLGYGDQGADDTKGMRGIVKTLHKLSYDFAVLADECYCEIYDETPPLGSTEILLRFLQAQT